jgi:hypothetical protein
VPSNPAIPEIEIALDVQATRIMQQMRSGPKQLRALAEELGAPQEAECQKREIDLRHDPSAQPDARQKWDRSGETSQ